MSGAGENVVNDFIIGQSFDENPNDSRNKEFCIDNAEYSEIKPRNLKRKVLVIALSLVGVVGAGVVGGIQTGYLGKHQESALLPSSVPHQTPTTTNLAGLPPSLQAPTAAAGEINPIDPVATPNPNVQTGVQSLPESLGGEKQTVNSGTGPAPLPTTMGALPQANTPVVSAAADKPLPPPLAQSTPLVSVSQGQTPVKAESKPVETKPVANKPVAAQLSRQASAPVVSKTAPAVVPKPQISVQAKQPVDHNPASPILVNTHEHTEDSSVKPLSMVSAERIGLRGLSKKGIQLQRGANIASYAVGDMLPNGETIKYIDDKTMTIVTDKQVMRVTN